jgi:hypothetical protein
MALGFFAWQTPLPWAGLWLMVPAAVAVSFLIAWRWGGWGVLAPVTVFAAAMVFEGPFSLWVWWIPVAALTGTWMGLREEGGGLSAGQRAWTLLPVLLLAVLLPWMVDYGHLVTGLEGWLKVGDQEVPGLYRQIGYQGEKLKAVERALVDSAALRAKALPHLLPTLLFLWMVTLVSAGRGLASRFAQRLRWPDVHAGRLADWRLPDAAIWLLLVGIALMVSGWAPWTTSAWTLLLNVGLGYCVQGVAVVESLMLARGVPPSIIALTFVFVFAMAMPVLLLATVCVGVSDVWLDFRGLEAVPDGDSS